MKIRGYKYILRFQVSVNNSPPMQVFQCLHNLRCVENSELDGQPFLVKLFDQFGESATLDVLIDEVEVFLVLNIHVSFWQSYIP